MKNGAHVAKLCPAPYSETEIFPLLNKLNYTLIVKKLLILFLFFSFKGSAQENLLPAFPGAEGGGMYSVGGRGGKVLFVENLNDNGPGSLRDAVSTPGARIVIFRVSGTIALDSVLVIRHDSLTIAGQTAPGDGICIKNYTLVVNADHIIIRFIRVRLGDESAYPEDAMSGIYGNKHIIIDHCSFSWGIDEVLTFWNVENLTVQWCIISESLNNSFHPKGSHGYGGIWGGTNSTYHHNLIAHHTSRTPRFSGGTTASCENVDFRNNVIYNWGYDGVYGGESGRINIVANYYKPGPATKKSAVNRIVSPGNELGKWFIAQNFIYNDSLVSSDNWNGGVHGRYSDNPEIRAWHPFPFLKVNTESPQDAYSKVLLYSGARVPKRDLVDERIINEVKNGTATFMGKGYSSEHNISPGIITGIIDSQSEVGGWPSLNSSEPPLDSDRDGMPDDWELKNGLDPFNPEDRNNTTPEGYTFLESYLNDLSNFNEIN